ncbi:hypothetical protein [Pendulispora albinea]|uniref:Uncharacterized protein n=1 Tax=Pendulispora albinea TaxID=2741071 RepID=A0ABZ2LJ02_9BACT
MSSNAKTTGIALVLGIGPKAETSPRAKAVALMLAAHGVAVVVMGEHERSLGEVVGEMVYGGGRARHVVGDVRVAEHVGGAIDKALGVFGEGRFLVVAFSETEALPQTMAAVGSALGSRGLSADVLFLGPPDRAEEPEKLAQRVASFVAFS